MFVAAVTGTNGKTSVAEFSRQVFDRTGRSAASIGSLGVTTPAGRDPDPFLGFGETALPRRCRRLEHEGIGSVTLEAFSSSIQAGQYDELDIDAAAFTNLSRDHLGYHDTVESYFAAKRRLFEVVLDADGTAIINADSDRADELLAVCETRGLDALTYGRRADADIRVAATEPTAEGTRVDIVVREERERVVWPIIGDVMLQNALCALGVALAADTPPSDAIPAMTDVSHPAGRLDRVATHDGSELYVDYAHTPDALDSALAALAPRADGRLVLVFGCGGDRDAGKRRQMGAVGHERADVAIVTDDNPRSEDPAAIRATVLDGCPDGIEVPDRRAAIERGISVLTPGDILVVAGKGHERVQIRDGETVPLSDAAAIRDVIGIDADG